MATTPVFASTPRAMCGLVPATLDTSFTAPTNVATLGNAGSSGTKVTQIDVIPVGTVVSGVVNIFAYDGSAYHLIASVQVSAVTVSTTAAAAAIASLTFDNLNLPSGWSLRCSVTVAGDQSLLAVNAYGADY